MVGKRKREDKDVKIRRKIQKLQDKLEKPRRRRVRVISSSEDESLCSFASYDEEHHARDVTPHPMSPTPMLTPLTTTAAMIHEPPPESTQNIHDSPPQEVCGDIELGEDILNLFGDAPKAETLLGKTIHKEIASRWQETLSKGLTKETCDKIGQEYLVPANCELLLAPTLNPEAKAALTDFVIKRDYTLLQKQKQIGTALTALARATELIITKETPDKILKPLSDACRLLCNAHYQDTKTRRNFVLSAVKPELKDTLINTSRNELLFGDNLSEQIKSAKNIQKSGEGLKVMPRHPVFNKNNFYKNKNDSQTNLNFKAFYRKPPPERYNSAAGRPQPAAQRWTRSRQPNQNRDRERSPPPYRCRSPPPPPPRRGRKY